MKRYRSLLIMVLALLLLFQVGCSASEGSSSGDKDVITLTFWAHQTETEQEFLQELAKKYNASQDKVKIKYKSINQSDYMTTALPVAFANNEGPDIFMISPGDFMKYAQSGVMADLNPYFPEGAKEDFKKTALDAVTFDSKVLALPFEEEPLGLYYNKKMLEEANIEVPKTWEDMQEAAKKLTTDKVAGLIIPPAKDVYLNFVWYPFLWQLGGSVLNEEETKSTFNSPETVRALNYWGSFFQKGYSPSKLKYGSSDIAVLGTGRAAMQIVGPWAITKVEKQFPDMEIGVAPLPVPEGGEAVTVAGGWKLAVNARSQHVEEAAKFAMWAFAEDPSRPLEWATEAKFAYPARKSVIEEGKEIYNKGLRKVFTEKIYETARPEPRFGPEIVDAIGEALQAVMFGGVSGEDAAEKADQLIQEALDDK